MSSKRVLSIRNAAVATFVVSLLAIATVAFGERVLPTVIVEMFTASATSIVGIPEKAAKPKQEARSEVAKTAKRAFGSPIDGLVFGQGQLPLLFPTRQDKIFRLGFEGNRTELSAVNDFEPSWSPEGDRIVFVSLRDGPEVNNFYTRQQSREIYIMNSDGTDQTRLGGSFYGGESQPSFSPHAEPDRKIIYVADYGPGGGPSGIFTMSTNGDNQNRIDTDPCFETEERRRPKIDRSNTASFFPGIYGFDTPNYSPDGNYIIFGAYGDNGVNVYRMGADGSDCTVLYESEGSGVATQARYSPDGTKIVLYHEVFLIAGAQNGIATKELRVIDADTGALLDSYEPTDISGWPVWSPDGGTIAYFSGYVDTETGDTYSNLGIRSIRLIDSFEDILYQQGVSEGLRGMSWGTPTTVAPPLSMRINSPNPLISGQSTTGTIYLSSPAPSGGATIQLQSLGSIDPPSIAVPATVVVPEGQSEATFTITSATNTLFRSADVLATRPSPDFAQSNATVTLSPSRADLRAVSLSAPAAVAAGVNFNSNWTVENIGPVITPSAYSDSIYFSLDNAYDSEDVELTGKSNGLLAAGETRNTVNHPTNIPRNLVPASGQYYLILRTNPNRNPVETDYTNNTVITPIQVNLADLVVENINVPATIEPGVTYPISWTVRNAGNAAVTPSPGSTYRNYYYFSLDNIAGNEDDFAFTLNQDFGTLAPGASYIQSTNFNIPTTPVRPTGQAFIYVVADAEFRVYEGPAGSTGETNNTTFAPVQFNYNVADLQVSATNVAADIDSDTSFPFSWTVTNAGNKAAPTFSDRVYLSTDDQIGGDTILGTFSLSGGLAAGGSANRIQNFTVPTGSIPASGNYYIYVLTDATSVVNEGVNENNNTRFQPVYIRRALRPDLVVTNVTAPSTVFFDQTVQVQWTVTNNGLGPTNAPQWTDTLYIGTSPTTLNGTTFLASPTSITALNPGESYTTSAIVKIPRGFNGGYYFHVRTNSNSTVNEENTGNNLGSRPVTVNVPPLPDLTVETVQAPDEVFAGQQVSISYTIRNIGTLNAGGRKDRIYLSRDTILNSGQDTLIFTSDSLYGPAAGQATTYTSHNRIGNQNPPVYQNVAIPSNLQGLWYVFVVTDFQDSVYEFTGENNNVGRDTVEPGAPMNILVSPPDLVVPNQPTAPEIAASGGNVEVQFTVRNQGAFNAAPFLYHAIYLSTDATFSPTTDTRLGTLRDPDFFGPGTEHLITMNVGIPYCLANGTYYLFSVADYDNRQFEYDPGFDAEANNASPARPIQLSTVPPDLQVTNFVVPPITAPGQIVPLSWTVVNAGGQDLRNWVDRVYLHSLTPGVSTQQVGSFPRNGGLLAGGSYTASGSIGLPSYMEGSYYLTVITDINNSVPECGAAEDNNSARSDNFTVANNLPDLVIDSVNAPTAATVGDTFNVQWVGRNANQQMPANSSSFRDSVYLSTNTTLSNDDIGLGSAINNVILGGGQTYPQQANVTIGNVSAGTYYILVLADSGTDIYEGTSGSGFESNNVRASAPITLSSPAVDLQVSGVSMASPQHSGTFRDFSWTVTNVGATQTLASSWTDYVILSRDSVLDPTDTTLGYRSRTGALAGGASYVATANYFVPVGLTGDYTIFVITDRNNSVVENNNNNNTSTPLAINLTLPPPAELNITNITPPPTIGLGGSATFNWTVQNTGANPINGQWRDTVYLSRDQFWDASDVLAGVRDLSSQTTTVPGGGGTYTSTNAFQIPPVEEGAYYVIVRTDAQNRIRESDEANNVSTSVGTTTVTITELQLNTPFNATLGNGGSMFFKYVTDPAETLVFSLVTDKPARSNEAFTKFNTMVSRANYDFFSTRPGEGDQENVIENTADGDYYSMVRTDLIPESFTSSFGKAPDKTADSKEPLGALDPQNITVQAKILPFSVRKTTPEESGNAGYATLLIEGAKFQAGATLKLVHSNGTQIVPVKRDVETSKIIAIFDLKGKAAGVYDIVVTNPDSQTATLEDGFTIVNGGGAAEARVTINGPGSTRGGRNRYTFTFANDGLNDQFFVPIIITMPTIYGYQLDESNYTGDLAEFLPQDAVPSQLPRHIDVNGTRAILLFAPIIASRRSVNVNIDITVPFGFADFQITAMTLPPLEDWGDIAAAGQAEFLERQVQQLNDPVKCGAKLDACLKEVLRGLIFSIISQIIPAKCVNFVFKGLVAVADMAIGIIKKGPETGFWDGVGAISNLIAGGLASAAIDCLGIVAPWVEVAGVVVFALKAMYDVWDCYRQYDDCAPPPPEKKNVSFPFSIDPNDKVGPKGYGAEAFVPVGQPLEYRINFENVASATAPAQLIRITDTLPPSLDLRTVKLKEIGFKQYRYILPPNQSFYQARVQLGEDLGNIQADILAGVDLVNNRVFWNLQAIDPNSSEAPLDPFAGLLPPNNANRDGEGYVIFTAEARSTFPNRTVISNSATIIFDQNEPIITNTTANLLDSVVPTSQIAALPPTSEIPVVSLNWSGTDDTDGSGFAGHSILFSENGSGYLQFVNSPADTTATFAGRWGKTYRFYSVGRDNAGNVEKAPAQPDATIRILGGDTEGDVAPRPNGSDGSVNGDDLTQIRRFIARLDSAMQYNEFQRIDTAPKATGGDGSFSVADVMQARRFSSGTDTRAEATGPNEMVPRAPKTIAGKSNGLLPREVKPITIIRNGNRIEVGILMETQGDETGLAFGLNFDPAVLSNPTFNLRPVAGAASLTVNTAQAATGKLGIMLDKAPNQPFPAGSNVLMTIVFDIAMGSPATTQMTIGDDPLIKEVVNGAAESLATTFSPGTIALLGPTASTVSVSGRVVAANGAPIKNARLTLSGVASERVMARTNAFGYFRFDSISSGRTYTLDVSARGYVFTPRILAVSDDIVDLEIFPAPE